MLHNTGPYGSNEAPINMGAPINMTQLNVPVLPHNLNNISKMPQQPPHPPTGSYDLPNYSPYSHQSVNMSPHFPPFPNYHSNILHNSFLRQSSSTMVDTGWQNGMLPVNLNIQSHQTPQVQSFQNFDLSSNNECKNTDLSPKLPINIPHYQSKPFQNEIPDFRDQVVSNFDQHTSYSNSSKQIIENNLEIRTKPPDILDHDITRRKTLENTIKMIENILVNTTKNREQEMCRENNNKKLLENENNEEIKNSELKIKNTYEKLNTSEHETSESEEDVKPNISHDNSTVTVKLEPISTDCENVFLRDINGVSREEAKDYTIIDGETSVMEASEVTKNGTKSNAYYECPYCKLLLYHPKRFLVHTKWHMFGLTRSRRLEMARAKSERRKLREDRTRLNSNQLTVEDIEKGKAFSCKDCDRIFGSKSSLKNHRQREHPTRTRECKICKKTVLGWMALRAHVASHTGDSGYQCADCPKRFKYAHSLAKHRDTHLEKTHGCDQCSKMFGSQALLKMHLKTHARALRGTTFRCTYCGKGFYEAWNLQVHERTHRNERPFLCEICNTSFGTNSSLKRHVKVSHSSSKPHECSTCHRCFMSAVILERHERRAHGDPEDFKFVCKQCPCRYMTSKDLQKHIYKVHPKCKRKRKSESDSE